VADRFHAKDSTLEIGSLQRIQHCSSLKIIQCFK
jgi:hypothetical protein